MKIIDNRLLIEDIMSSNEIFDYLIFKRYLKCRHSKLKSKYKKFG